MSGKREDRAKNRNAVELGKLGGKVGGPARAQDLSAYERSKIARMGARAANSRRRGAEHHSVDAPKKRGGK